MNDNYTYTFGKQIIDLSSRTHVMGILNVTPDSFSDGGKYLNVDDAVEYGKQMAADGADFIDIGGASTRPGSDEISVDEELGRIMPVLLRLKDEIALPLSVDTYRSEVADEALKNGAMIINDISAFNFDEKMPEVVSKHKATCILMHIKGTPKNMQENPEYENVVAEILKYFEQAVWKANVNGIDQVIIDPGFGFGKTPEHNLTIVKNLSKFKKLDCPVMIGVSRKSTIGKLSGGGIDDRLEGTIALNTISILNGVNLIRVHDVKENVRAAKLIDSYRKLST
jgi:dihydropteroate synthase